MTETEEPERVKIFRIIPQIKTFDKGVLLKTKQDLYYSLEEDIVETGGKDNFSAFALNGGSGAANSFAMSDKFLHKEMTVMFVEAGQFRASDGNVYVRGQILTDDKAVWVNIAKVSQTKWGYMIRSEQKTLIKDEMKKMFSFFTNENKK